MKKYRIEYDGFDTLLEDLGEDFATLIFNVYPEDKNESFFVTLPFSDFINKLQDMNPEMHSLISKIEKGIKKWGMHDSVTIHELEECGINVGALAIKVIESAYDLEKEEIRQANIKPSPGVNTASEILKDLNESASQMKIENENYFLLCTHIEKALTTEMMELFPVIFNSSSKNILAFEDILIKHIPKIADDLNDLIRDAQE